MSMVEKRTRTRKTYYIILNHTISYFIISYQAFMRITIQNREQYERTHAPSHYKLKQYRTRILHEFPSNPTYTHTYLRIHIHLLTYIHTHTYIHYIYTYVYIYIRSNKTAVPTAGRKSIPLVQIMIPSTLATTRTQTRDTLFQ